MEHASRNIPQGIWAIGSDLESVAETQSWLFNAEPAVAVSLRRPCGGHGEALACLKAMTAQKDFVAVHGMADLALAAKAQAVIAGFRSLPLTAYRDRFPELLLGASTHSEEEVMLAEQAGADFLIYGPIWETPEKQGILQARGLNALQELCATTALPVIAIGGIQSTEQVSACQNAGVHAVAVLRAAKDLICMTDLRQAWRD